METKEKVMRILVVGSMYQESDWYGGTCWRSSFGDFEQKQDPRREGPDDSCSRVLRTEDQIGKKLSSCCSIQR